MTEDVKVITGRLKRPPAVDGAPPRPKIFIATPAYGGMVTVEFLVGFDHLCRSLDASGLEHVVGMLTKESLITRARNKLVADFLKTDCTHLFFIDADIGFKARDAKYLIEADLDVVCGCYPMKNLGWKNIAEAAQRGVKPEDLVIEGARYAANVPAPGANGAPIRGLQKLGTTFLEAQDAATGFLLIKRSAIERFIEHYRDRIQYMADYEPDYGQTHHMVFQADRDPMALSKGEPARYLSEDYWFSRMWQMMGGQVWLCLGPELTHTGQFHFIGKPSTLFEQTKSPEEAKAPAAATPEPTAAAAG
jgi:hypothetical protein